VNAGIKSSEEARAEQALEIVGDGRESSGIQRKSRP